MEKIIFVNQKMYFNSLDEIKTFQLETKHFKDKFVVFPSSIYLENFINKGFITGIQNISSENNGPHTGEISAKSIKEIGAKYVIIGHHEIRKQYKEENNLIQKKLEKAIENNLKVILCVGETIEEKVNDKTYNIIKQELENLKFTNDVIISYEPVWAIGSHITPTNDEIEKIVDYIKSLTNLDVIYGGSVSEDNIETLNKIPNLSGFLLGSGALKSSSLNKIIEVVLK